MKDSNETPNTPASAPPTGSAAGSPEEAGEAADASPGDASPTESTSDPLDESLLNDASASGSAREKRLRGLINRLPGAVYRCTYDTEWKSLYMGAGFADICGIPPETLDPSGRSFRDVIVSEDIPRIKEAVAEAVATRNYYRIEYRVEDNNGTVRWLEDNGRPYFEDGAVLWLDGILIDVTDRKEARESLRRMNETLEEAVEMRTQQVRHLAAQLAMVEQRERNYIAHTLHNELQQFLYGVQVQTKMFTDAIQSHTDIDPDSLPVDPSRVERLLQEAIDTTRGLTVDLSPPVLKSDGLPEALQWLRSHMAETHDFQVALNADLPTLSIPEGVRLVVIQAVRELLMNAKQHAGVNAARVDVDEDDDAVVITVSDDGSGFDVEDTLEDAHPGYGLRTAKERLRFMGGRLDIRSDADHGTRCAIRLSKEELRNISLSVEDTAHALGSPLSSPDPPDA